MPFWGTSSGSITATMTGSIQAIIDILEGKSEQDPESLAQFYLVINDWLVRKKNTRFCGGESFDEGWSRLNAVQALMSIEQTVVVGHCALFAVFLGTRGTFFRKVEDLFLPRGGMATYDQLSRTWRIGSTAEPRFPQECE
jgi:hypothetical protein